MCTKKRFNLGVCMAIYGFISAIAFPVFMGLKLGFDSAVPDGSTTFIIIHFIVAFIGIAIAIVNYKKMSTEKVDEITSELSQTVCRNCKTNVKSGTEACPKCGSLIK